MQSQKGQNGLCLFQGKPFNITVIQVYAPTSNAEEAEVERFYKDLQDLLEQTPKKDILFIIGEWNAKVQSQEIPGVTGNLALEYKMNHGKGQRSFVKRLLTTQEMTLHGHHQRVNTEIRLIIFFAAKDGEALYSQQKQDRELTVAQIMNSLLPNSDLN